MSKIAFSFKPKRSKRLPAHFFKDSPLIPLRRADGKPVTIRNFKNSECRWPYGGPAADMLMCGRPVEAAPYCKEHRAAAYRCEKPGRDG